MRLHLHYFFTHDLSQLNLFFYFIFFIICNHTTHCERGNSISYSNLNASRNSPAGRGPAPSPNSGARPPPPPPSLKPTRNAAATPPPYPSPPPSQKATRNATATPPPPGQIEANATETHPARTNATATPPSRQIEANATETHPARINATATPASGKKKSKVLSGYLIAVLIIGLGVAGIAINVGIKILLCCWRRHTFSSDKLLFWKKKIKDAQNVEAFLKNHEFLATKRYKYSEIKKMTNSFKDKLGQGGYGGVFKGKLIDGRMVAMKVLSESKGNGEEFINEVATISRTSHVNVVTLLGFCVEDSKRALVYEFMPNGSLEKFIYNEKSLQSHPHLEWETLYKIALGIARGLEYLHRGCSTRILHFDIKPHNILLDHEFCPKIVDFGLAKLCVKKESIISMIGTRGTPGYIAPELINRNFGGVSHKSDVYSYGMMVLEMVGGRKNIDVEVENISEIYFPHWIHKRLSKCGVDLGLWGVTTIEDEDIARKMILVSLWCIQMDPSTRPAMNRVLEMLEGNLNALQIPHMSFFTSPPRSQVAPSTTSSAVDEIVIL